MLEISALIQCHLSWQLGFKILIWKPTTSKLQSPQAYRNSMPIFQMKTWKTRQHFNHYFGSLVPFRDTACVISDSVSLHFCVAGNETLTSIVKIIIICGTIIFLFVHLCLFKAACTPTLKSISPFLLRWKHKCRIQGRIRASPLHKWVNCIPIRTTSGVIKCDTQICPALCIFVSIIKGMVASTVYANSTSNRANEVCNAVRTS